MTPAGGARPEALLIGEFAPELRAIIGTELACFSQRELMDHPQRRAAVRVILTRSNCAIAPALLDLLPGLQIIATCGVGYDGIPVALAQRRKVVVTHTPGILDGAVAELAIGMLLGLLRQIPAADRFVREGRWPTAPFPLGVGLAHKRVGIVGLGRIGKRIAQRLLSFEVSLSYCGSAPQNVPYLFFRDVRDLAREVDILILCCPGGAATRHAVDAEVLQRLGPTGYLVNVSRGSVVDEAALVHALKNGIVGGAALDVYADEPLPHPELRTLPNTLLTPHIGSGTHETRLAMLRLTLDNIHRVLGGLEPLTAVPVQGVSRDSILG